MEIYHKPQELAMAKQDIVIYPNRKRLIMLAWRIVLLFILCSGMAVFWFVFLRLIVSPFNTMIIEVILVLVCAAFALVWAFWKTLRVLYVHQPALVINSKGIQVHTMPGSGNFFIHWAEIDAIFVHSYRGTRYLSILPKEPKGYWSRFNVLKRLWMSSYKLTGLPPINVSLPYLDMPIAEILQQLSQRFAFELSEDHVRLLP